MSKTAKIIFWIVTVGLLAFLLLSCNPATSKPFRSEPIGPYHIADPST